MKTSYYLMLILASAAFAQPTEHAVGRGPIQAVSTSQFDYHADKDGAEVVAINNVEYELTGTGVPGRKSDEILLLRKTVHINRVVTEIGQEAKTTVEAWTLGVNPKQPPLYTISTDGMEPRIVNSEVITILRGVEETEWWSVYQLGTGKRLFDTYVPLVQFSISRETLKLRYVGIEVPEDDVADKRLRAPNVVGILTYASPLRVIREGLITCDDPKKAVLLRSFADSTRTMSGDGRAIRLSITQDYPSAPSPVSITVPVAGDDLDLAHVQAPAGVKVTAWKR